MPDSGNQQDIQGIFSQMMAMAPFLGGQRAVDEASMPWNQPYRPGRVNSSEPSAEDSVNAAMANAPSYSQEQLNQMFPGLPPAQQQWMARQKWLETPDYLRGFIGAPGGAQGAAASGAATGAAPMTWGRALGLQQMGIEPPNAPWNTPGWHDGLARAWNQQGGAPGLMRGVF